MKYKSPLLSPNGKYLSCIAHGPEDFVYVWEMSDLYWYKYKFTSSYADCVAFTPDSKSIILVYRYSSPTKYDLSSGKKYWNLKEMEKRIIEKDVSVLSVHQESILLIQLINL